MCFSRGRRYPVGNFTSQDFVIFPHSCCADSSSPRISAILVGRFTVENDCLCKSPRFSTKLPKRIAQNNIESWLAKFRSIPAPLIRSAQVKAYDDRARC